VLLKGKYQTDAPKTQDPGLMRHVQLELEHLRFLRRARGFRNALDNYSCS
jgi:hypothetical protein